MHLVAIESRNYVIVRVFPTDTICTDWILVPLVTITTMCNAEYQSKYDHAIAVQVSRSYIILEMLVFYT